MLSMIFTIVFAAISIFPHDVNCQVNDLSSGSMSDETVGYHDTDLDDSNHNVNVNINSNSPRKMPWHEPNMYTPYRQPDLHYYGKRGKGKGKRGSPYFRLKPNSNIDLNFGHPGGNVRLERKKPSRRKQNAASIKDSEISLPTESTSVCYPIILQVVRYMQRIETNMKDLEKELRTFLLASKEKTSNNNLTSVPSE